VTILLTGLWFASTILPACNKSNQAGKVDTANSSITTLLKASTGSTYFYYAMTRTKLDSVLDIGYGSRYTVFVPTDNAFQNSGISMSYLQAATDSTLKNMLLYLIAKHGILSTDIKGSNQATTEANNESVYLTSNANGFFINAISIDQANDNIIALNGVIHFINSSVPLAPKGDLFQLLESDTTFTYLSAAVNKTSTALGAEVILILDGSGHTLTLFAPTNQAFRAFGFPDTASINAASPDSLNRLLGTHILNSVEFNSDISNGERYVGYFSNDTLQFNLSGMSLQVSGNHNAVPANVIKANTIATNGVLYTIDQVLKP
jgi:uncharacterized surface protein with fasciclin (FAS1) repeats